jgi:AraC family L-rhamnose operon transcriptional activator RhaR/AraC family L-rhamnose operon regulatory protein RhaS
VSELVIILDGRGTHVVGREEFLIGAGDVFVLQGPWRHGFKKMDGLSLWNIMYHPMLLNGTDAFLRKIPGYHALFKLEPRFRPQHGFRSRLRLSPSRLLTASQLADRIAREYSERSEGYQAVIQGLFWQLVTFLARQYSGVKTEEGQKLLRIGQGISFLENHYRDPISLQDLADQVHLSVNQMLRVFKEITSESPIQYLLHYRIRKACELLHCSSLKITTIGLEVGFSDSNYFARQFRKIMGKSPQEYRDERLGRK